MYPWIDLYFFKIPSFGLMVATAFLVCHYLLKKEFNNQNIDEKIIDDIIFYAVISAIIGSKIYYIIETQSFNMFFANIQNIFIKLFSANFSGFILELQSLGSGLVFNGGFICALLLISSYIYKHKLDFLHLADIVTPYILLGHGIGRIGCFLVGDDYGLPSKLPWAVSFPDGLPTTTINTIMTNFSFLNYTRDDLASYLIEGQNSVISVHPTQIYEMILYFIGFVFIKQFYNYLSFKKGSIFSIYLIIGGFSRFAVEFLRTNERYVLNLSSAQYISMVMIFSGFLFLTYLSKKYKDYGIN
jgi:phosphatidylglycerol:prolipoprotein diacylglycerol transferase